MVALTRQYEVRYYTNLHRCSYNTLKNCAKLTICHFADKIFRKRVCFVSTTALSSFLEICTLNRQTDASKYLFEGPLYIVKLFGKNTFFFYFMMVSFPGSKIFWCFINVLRKITKENSRICLFIQLRSIILIP